MKWKKASDYAIECGRFGISKSLVNGKYIFTLWDGKKRIADFDTPEKAKGAARER